MTTAHDQPYGLMFGDAVAASELREGQIVVLDGHVIGVSPDPDVPGSVRVLLRRALGPPPGTDPDQRPIEVVCPPDMLFGTAAPHNIDLAPPGADS